MADISKITVDGVEHDIKDKRAREALKQATAIRVTNAMETDVPSILVGVTLEDGTGSASIINLDDNGYPKKIITDGVECAVEWEGF